MINYKIKILLLIMLFASCKGSQLFVEAGALATTRKTNPIEGTPGTFTFRGVTEFEGPWTRDYGLQVQPFVKLTYRQYIFKIKD